MRGSIVKRGKTYSIVFMMEDSKTGKKKQKWVGGFKTKKEAEKALSEALYKVENGSYINPESITVSEYLTDWLKIYAEPNLSPTTIDGYRVNIQNHINPYIGNIPIQKLRPINIQELYNQLKANGRYDGKGGLSAKSILYVHRVLREGLEHAVCNQLLSRNPANDVKPPSVEKYSAQVMNSGEILTLLKAVKDSEYELPFALSALLGLRRGEVLGLQWSDINFNDQTININNQIIPTSKGIISKKPKSKDSIRSIPIPAVILKMIRKQQKHQMENKLICGQSYSDNNLVCCKVDGSPYSPTYFTKVFTKILKENGLKHIRYHDLRHSAATNMLKNGVDIKTVSTILGHSTIGITLDIYSHVENSMKKDALDKVQRAIFGYQVADI